MKKVLSIVLILLLCSILLPSQVTAATKKHPDKTKAVYSIGIKDTITLSINTKSKITWSSSNKSIATVSKNGKVTGKKNGKVTITAKVGNKNYTCKVVVNEYSKWVPYNTSNLKTLAKNILNGNVVYYNGQYFCTPEFYERIKKENIIYDNNISGDTINDRYQFTDVVISKESTEWLYESDLEKQNIYFSNASFINEQFDIDIWSFKKGTISCKQLYVVPDMTKDFIKSDNASATFSDIKMKKEDGQWIFYKEDLIEKGIISK